MNPALQPDTALVRTIVERRRETRRPPTQARISEDGTVSSLWCWTDDIHAAFVLSSPFIEFRAGRALVDHTREPGVSPTSMVVTEEQRATKLKGGSQRIRHALVLSVQQRARGGHGVLVHH